MISRHNLHTFNSPRLANEGFDAADRDVVRAVDRQLTDVAVFQERFFSALELFNFCVAQRRAIRTREEESGPSANDSDSYDMFISWEHIAGRDAALTIWDFGHNIHQIAMNVRRCKRLSELVPNRELEKLATMFAEAFPKAKDIRDASAHPADMQWTPYHAKRNSFDGPLTVGGVDVIVGQPTETYFTGIVERHVTVTIKGQAISYELSTSSLDKINELRLATFSTFQRASNASFEMMFEAEKRGAIDPKR